MTSISWNKQVQHILAQYESICNVLGEVCKDRTLFHELIRDSRRVEGVIIACLLQCTIKTHKPAGDVVPRVIHASRKTLFKPFLRFVAFQLRKLSTGTLIFYEIQRI